MFQNPVNLQGRSFPLRPMLLQIFLAMWNQVLRENSGSRLNWLDSKWPYLLWQQHQDLQSQQGSRSDRRWPFGDNCLELEDRRHRWLSLSQGEAPRKFESGSPHNCLMILPHLQTPFQKRPSDKNIRDLIGKVLFLFQFQFGGYLECVCARTGESYLVSSSWSTGRRDTFSDNKLDGSSRPCDAKHHILHCTMQMTMMIV